MSKLLFRSLREAPAEAEVKSHQLLLRGGFIQQLASGVFSYLPLGWRVAGKASAILRAEMEALGGQEVSLPVVQPAELWRRSGRWEAVGEEMARFKDRVGRDLLLAITHEEAVTELAAQVVRSYRQLPALVYQLQTKFRDEPRARGGLIRTREFVMKDAYSFHADERSLDATYREVYAAYERIFRRCGLEVLAVESDNGVMGGSASHEFMALSPIGEDTVMLCDGCGYRANRQVAIFQKPQPEAEEAGTLEAVPTPDTPTIEALAALLGVPEARTAKAVFFTADMGGEDRLIFAVVRGDMELNETKLANAVQARRLRPATPDEIRRVGAEPGYASPIGIQREGVTVVVDDFVARSPNLLAGANRAGYHLRNTNCGRDHEADLVADLAAARGGDPCAHCGTPLRAVRGVEVGNIFKLGTRYSEALGASFSAETGERRPLVMGSYGIGVGRLVASVAQAHHDERGLLWPAALAPYHVSLVAVGAGATVKEVAQGLYRGLWDAGVEVLFDDRDERPGVKFSDADLIGLPARVTVGERGLGRGVMELKVRRTGEVQEVPLEEVAARVRTQLEAFSPDLRLELERGTPSRHPR